jgi:hypothetical protein
MPQLHQYKQDKRVVENDFSWVYFFSPSRMAKSVFPPIPTIMDMAMIKMEIGKQRVIPAIPDNRRRFPQNNGQ